MGLLLNLKCISFAYRKAFFPTSLLSHARKKRFMMIVLPATQRYLAPFYTFYKHYYKTRRYLCGIGTYLEHLTGGNSVILFVCNFETSCRGGVIMVNDKTKGKPCGLLKIFRDFMAIVQMGRKTHFRRKRSGILCLTQYKSYRSQYFYLISLDDCFRR